LINAISQTTAAAQQLTRFKLAPNVAQSLGDSLPSCLQVFHSKPQSIKM